MNKRLGLYRVSLERRVERRLSNRTGGLWRLERSYIYIEIRWPSRSDRGAPGISFVFDSLVIISK